MIGESEMAMHLLVPGNWGIPPSGPGEKIKKDAAEKTREMQGKLIEKSRAAREKLEELKAAGSEKWQAVRKDLDRMLSELENAYHRAVSKMKSYEKQDR